jgi:septal ring factor EnvC (AmiA/AmiB activator)
MNTNIIAAGAGAGNADLPASRSACQAQLAEINDAIAAIRAQIAAADLDRQAQGRTIDPRWFHRAKTALRHKQREREHLIAHMADLPGRKDALKDTLIAVLRETHDEDAWAQALDEAHRRLTAEGPR